jgi:4-hydroxy-2-oxoglutarate aldolase
MNQFGGQPEQALLAHGVFPPITTPFNARGDVDYRALAANIERWNQYDLAGYVILGSNGEGVYLDESEKARVLEATRRSIPTGKLMIAGTGCESARQTIALTRRAVEIGADIALVITPHFFDAHMTPDALVRYFSTIADASAVPVMLYNVPKFTHVDMDATTIGRAAQHPNIIGLKDSGGNITKLADVVRQVPRAFQVLAGSAGFFFASLAIGAVGGVLALANIAPQQCIDIYRLFRAGQWEEAAELQRKMIPVNTAITARFGVAGLKDALELLGYAGGSVRAPLLDLDEKAKQTLRGILSEGGLL